MEELKQKAAATSENVEEIEQTVSTVKQNAEEVKQVRPLSLQWVGEIKVILVLLFRVPEDLFISLPCWSTFQWSRSDMFWLIYVLDPHA